MKFALTTCSAMILGSSIATVSAFQTGAAFVRTHSTTSAFVPSPTVLYGERAEQAAIEAEAKFGPDSPQAQAAWEAAIAIKEAMAASEQFGPASPEARVAWDAVEEINARDNNAAYETTGEKLSEAELNKMTAEFQENIATVQRLANDSKLKQEQLQDIAARMAAIKLAPPEKKPAAQSPEVQKALAEAYAISEQYGFDSPEARVAWTELEEIASSGLENAMGGNLSAEECLLSAAEACIALNEFESAMRGMN